MAQPATEISSVRAGAVMVLATGLDTLVNYPLWILGKRLGAGLKAPTKVRDYYKGSSLMLVSYAPTLILEENIIRSIGDNMPPLQGSMIAGVAGALAVTTWVETQITRLHAARHTTTAFPPLFGMPLRFPCGSAMLVCREVPFCCSLFCLHDYMTSRNYHHIAASLVAGFVGATISHVPSVIVARQQAHPVSLMETMKAFRAIGLMSLWKGYVPRTLSLVGTMLVVPMVRDSATIKKFITNDVADLRAVFSLKH